MAIIELNTGDCHNCYKCIRECPVKAIEFKAGHANIIESECILCGECVLSCAQNAKFITNNTASVKKYIADGHKVYASIAPSWKGWYDSVEFSRISTALKKLGFHGVEETAIGAHQASKEYENLIESSNMKNIIVTACSSVVMLVERHFPHLIKMLAPVSSPMMAHARVMRETYGDIKVIFIGPCISKKFEASDPLSGGLVNHTLSFAELDEWLNSEKIILSEQLSDEQAVGISVKKSRLYPKPYGILQTIDKQYLEKYTPVAVTGSTECMELFQMMENDESLTGMFIEANICSGGCLGGPFMRMADKKHVLITPKITELPMKQDLFPALSTAIDCPHPRVFSNRRSKNKLPTDKEIVDILAKIGKTTSDDEINCGSCGYRTCRDKAVAVYQGKADIHMCLPYFRDRAENLSNTVIEHSPNAILVFDENLFLQELNPTAESMFKMNRNDCLYLPISTFYGETDFDESKNCGKALTKKIFYADIDKTVEQTILYIKEHRLYLAFVKDISEQEHSKIKIDKLREHTVDVAQNVINKQMRVAQEIASLLGETTAETKVALTNLKKSMETLSEL